MSDDSAEALPAVSVILPTYQRRELATRTVASVFAQTVTDWELIVVDDGSTDGTREALTAVRDHRLHYHWQPNQGVAAARNTALRHALAPIIAFLDSDNRWLPEHLAVTTAMLNRHPEAIMATTCPRFVIGGSERLDEALVLDLRRRLSWYGGRLGFTSCVVVRRAAVTAVGGFDERMKAAEDTDLWLRLGTLGPICTIRRRTLIRHATGASLGERSRRNGDYLTAAELSASNLVTAIRSLPEPEQEALIDQGLAEVHIARAMRAISVGDASALSSELETACRLTPHLNETAAKMVWRIASSLPGFDSPPEQLRALAMLAEAWPDPRADSARFARWLAISTALRAGRLETVIRLALAWPRGRSMRFLLRQRGSYRRAVRHMRPVSRPGRLSQQAESSHTRAPDAGTRPAPDAR